ncbi:unnamed protein product [Miscanthus lutarioriparius]|uniref:Pentatricopeptide repeat-containing protein n=1 Tax=Miscanthus lutarioriparius TaxID=422564 RepID=A0A811PEZ5_9POAL|nr:unnamed protein product [Miscanthus lutarioriparius]
MAARRMTWQGPAADTGSNSQRRSPVWGPDHRKLRALEEEDIKESLQTFYNDPQAARAARPQRKPVPSTLKTMCPCRRNTQLPSSNPCARAARSATPAPCSTKCPTMLSGYASSARHREALDLFWSMAAAGVIPNEFTLSSVLTACRAGGGGGAASIHALALRRGVDHTPYVVNALINAYASRGGGDGLVDARWLFDALGEGRTAASWTSMIAGYARWGQENTGLQLFQNMIQDDVELSPFTCSIAIHACALVASCQHGYRTKLLDSNEHYISMCWSLSSEMWPVHGALLRRNYGDDLKVSNALVDMYSKCGKILNAKKVFNMMTCKDILSWTSMIVGRLREAFILIDTILTPDESIWGALLGACKMHRNLELGRLAAGKIIEINPDAVKTYILLANICAADSKWGEYAVTRMLLRGTGSSKEVGMSWIELTDKMYSFSTADSSSPQVSLADEVLQILVHHMDEAGSDFIDNICRGA